MKYLKKKKVRAGIFELHCSSVGGVLCVRKIYPPGKSLSNIDNSSTPVVNGTITHPVSFLCSIKI